MLVEASVLAMGALTAFVFAACGYRLRRRSETAAQPSLAAKPAAPRDARRRFSLALASLAAAAAALGCYAPLRFELWRQAEETLRWAERDMQIIFKYLSGQTMLEELDLRDAAVTDLGLTSLMTLNNLKRLDLRGARVTPRGCRDLAQNLPNCEILR